MPSLRIYLPYKSVPVRVRLGYGTALSRMEIMVLRTVFEIWRERRADAAAAGSAVTPGVGLSKLQDLLRLGNRMILDLVFDLWRREHVALDLYSGTVAPSPDVIDAFDAGRQDRLRSGEFKLDTIDVWLDRVSGHLTGRFGYVRPPDRELVVPADALFSATVNDVSGADVVRAVQESLEDQQSQDEIGEPGGRGRKLRVLETKLPLAADMPTTPRTTYLPVDITVRRDPESDLVRVSAVQDSRRGLVHYERIGALLTQFLELRPNHRFSRRLQSSLEIRLTDPPSIERSIAKLESLADHALTAVAGSRTAVHSQLVEAIRTVRTQVDLRVTGEAQVDLVDDDEKYRDVVRSLIGSAKRQVVLVASTIRYDPLADLLPALRDAVGQGVQVVLLWGRRHDDKIDDRAARVLDELRMEATAQHFGPASVVMARRPANANANMVIADNHSALVGGYRFLDRRNDARQLGAIVRAVEPGGCEPVSALLRWVRRTTPDSTTASRVFFRDRDFAPREEDQVLPAQRLPWSDLPTQLDSDAVSDAAVRSWALAWRRCAAEVRQNLAARKWPSVTLVENAMHRDALWDGLRAAKTQIVIASEYIASSVVTPKLVEVLRQGIGTGVRTDIRYRHLRKGSEQAIKLLETAATAAPTVLAVHREESAARALICDDDLVVGSFDFLSHEGFYSRQAGRRPAAEVGLRISGGDIALEAAALLGAPIIRRPKPALVKLDRFDHRTHQLLVELENHTDPAERNAVIVRTVAGGKPLSLLNDLDEAGATEDVMRVAVAAALRGRLVEADQELSTWADWLIDDLWKRRRFVEAWVLRQGLPHGALPLSLATVAGVANTPFVAEALTNAVLADSLTGSQAAALVALGAAQVLSWPRRPAIPPVVATEVREAVRVLAELDATGSDWRALATFVVDCPQDLDMPGLAAIARDQLAHRHRESRLAELWDVADEALAALAGMSFTFEAGLKTQAYLLHSDGIFGQLRAIIDNRDLTALAKWIRKPELTDLPGFVDQTSAELMRGRKNNVIHSSKRRVYLDRLRQVQATAEHVAAFGVDQDGTRTPHKVALAWPLAEHLARLWPRLLADLQAHPAPERHLTEHALSAIAVLRDWGEGSHE